MKKFDKVIQVAISDKQTKEQFYSRIFELIWSNGWNELNRKELVEHFRDETNTLILRWYGHENVGTQDVEEVIDEIIEICLQNNTIEKMPYSDVMYYCMPKDKANSYEFLT